jgi:hypothetical protein
MISLTSISGFSCEKEKGKQNIIRKKETKNLCFPDVRVVNAESL